MKRIYSMYLIIIAGIVLIVHNVSELDFDNLQKGPYYGIVLGILLILTMIFTIRDVKKKEND